MAAAPQAARSGHHPHPEEERRRDFFNEGELFLDHYNLGPTLGSGSFATTKRAVHKASQQTYAVKIIKLGKLSKEDVVGLQTELEVLRKLNHRNICTMHEVYREPGRIFMVMEEMHGGELLERMLDQQKYMELEAKKVGPC